MEINKVNSKLPTYDERVILLCKKHRFSDTKGFLKPIPLVCFGMRVSTNSIGEIYNLETYRDKMKAFSNKKEYSGASDDIEVLAWVDIYKLFAKDGEIAHLYGMIPFSNH